MRWYVLQTLIRKELLRYRYNLGPLVVVIALLVLAALISTNEVVDSLPGQGGASVRVCEILHRPGCRWAQFLKDNPPPTGRVVLRRYPTGAGAAPRLGLQRMAIELLPGSVDPQTGCPQPGSTWKARIWYTPSAPNGLHAFRDWFERESFRFLQMRPQLEIDTRQAQATVDMTDRIPMLIAGFVMFAIFIHAFQLYLTSTAEERDKRQMLAVLLSPARPAEVVLAKALFYVAISLVVAAGVMGMYAPRVLFEPVFWSTVTLSAVGYVSLATLALVFVHKLNNVNALPMLYLLGMGIVMVLSTFIGVFAVLRRFLLEHYLIQQLHELAAQQWPPLWWLKQVGLVWLAVSWLIVVLFVLSKRAVSIARTQ